MENSVLTPAQIEILDMVSFAQNDEMLSVLKEAIASYCASMIENEINSLWDLGILNQEKIESFRQLHQRTPYKN